MRSTQLKTPGRFFFTFAAVLLLVLMALLAGGAARRESVTFDEIAHIGAGVSYLQKLDMRMNEEHPPLAKVVAAIPLVLRGAHADYGHHSWTFSSKIFRQYFGEWVFGHWFLMQWNDPYSTLLWARAPMLLMTLLLGLTLYLCGSRLGGPWGGLLCLSAFVTMPAFIAFGPLVITDIAVTLFWVLTVWQLPNMWRSPTRGKVVMFGLVLAGALLSKFSSGLLFSVFVAFALSLRFKPLPEQPAGKVELHRWRRRAWRNIGIGTLWAALFVYIVYFVLSWNQPTDSFQIIPDFPASLVLRRLLMPVWLYLRGLAGFALGAGSRPTFILGHAYSHGVWFYFPALFLLKSQLTFLLLLLLAIAAAMLVGPVNRAAGDTCRHGNAVEKRMGFPGDLRCGLHVEPAGHQHSPFLSGTGAGCLAACSRPAHAGAAEGLEPANGTHRKLAGSCAGAGFLGHGHTHLPELFSLPEYAQHGAAGLHPGQRFESGLEPGTSASREFRAPTRFRAGAAR